MTGTPTGRINRDSDFITEMFKSLQITSPPRYLREAMSVLAESTEKVIMAVDFSRLEDRTVALLCSMSPEGVFVHKEVKLYDEIQGRKATMCIMDDLESTVSDGSDLLDSIKKAVTTIENINQHHVLFENPTAWGKSYTYHKTILSDNLEVSVFDKPLKQNGRSASYLDLDPTKKNINKRRKR